MKRVTVLALSVFFLSCASSPKNVPPQTQSGLPYVSQIDTRNILSAEMTNRTGILLWDEFSRAMTEGVNKAFCLYGRVGETTLEIADDSLLFGKLLTIAGFSLLETAEFDSALTMDYSSEHCEENFLGIAHTHIRGMSVFSSVDIISFWDQEESTIMIALWGVREIGGRKFLYMTWQLKHGASGVWRWFPGLSVEMPKIATGGTVG